MTELEKFRDAFLWVKARGEFESNRSGNTGIGKTLEDVIGVEENNFDAPDLHGFEIKSQRLLSSSYVTLFTKAPTYPKRVNNQLRLKYGSEDAHFPDVKVLHTSIFATKWNTHKSGFSYTLERDDTNERLGLFVKNTDSGDIVEDSIYWSYEVLAGIVSAKLENLAFVQADTRKENGKEFFTFNSCKLYHGLSLERLLAHIDDGSIMFDIRIGAYKNPEAANYGKMHDHGSGFRIRKEKLLSLYDTELIL